MRKIVDVVLFAIPSLVHAFYGVSILAFYQDLARIHADLHEITDASAAHVGALDGIDLRLHNIEQTQDVLRHSVQDLDGARMEYELKHSPGDHNVPRK